MIKWDEFVDKAKGNQTDKAKGNQTDKAGTPVNTSNSDANAKAQTPGTETDATAKTNGVTAGLLGGTLAPSHGTVGTNKKSYTYTTGANNKPYMDQLNSLYDQIVNRKPFQYDLNGDLLYREIADRYTQMGRQAMRDATGVAAGLTGGYGNSYATQVGNQAYQQYLTALNDNIPQLWDRAYQAYQDQGNQLLQQYELTAAHPGYLDAISPKTYTVTTDDTDKNTAYTQALQNAGLYFGGVSSLPENQLDDWVYKILENQKK